MLALRLPLVVGIDPLFAFSACLISFIHRQRLFQDLHQVSLIHCFRLLTGQCSAHSGREWSGPTTTLNIATTSLQ